MRHQLNIEGTVTARLAGGFDIHNAAVNHQMGRIETSVLKVRPWQLKAIILDPTLNVAGTLLVASSASLAPWGIDVCTVDGSISIDFKDRLVELDNFNPHKQVKLSGQISAERSSLEGQLLEQKVWTEGQTIHWGENSIKLSDSWVINAPKVELGLISASVKGYINWTEHNFAIHSDRFETEIDAFSGIELIGDWNDETINFNSLRANSDLHRIPAVLTGHINYQKPQVGYFHGTVGHGPAQFWLKRNKSGIKMHAVGDDMQVTKRADREIYGNANVIYTVEPERTTLVGKLEVTRAYLKQLRWDETPLSSDLEVEHGWDPELHLVIALDKVNIELPDWSAKLDGSLRWDRVPGQDMKTSGVLRILEGEVYSFSKPLTVSRGELHFNQSALSRPHLTFEARRKVQTGQIKSQDQWVGIRYQGHIDKFEPRIFAEPALSNKETLSYLMLDKPLEQAGDKEFSINNLARIAGRNPDEFAQKMGFTTMDVRYESSANAKDLDNMIIALGKQLTEDIHVQIEYGLLKQYEDLKAQFKLSDNVYVDTQANRERQSADLMVAFDIN